MKSLFCIAVLLGVTRASAGQQAAPQASGPTKTHPALLSQGFEFREIDKVCVLPPVDMRRDERTGEVVQPPWDLSFLRPAVMKALVERGYPVFGPGCFVRDAKGATLARGVRWVLAVSLDSVAPVAAVLTADLVDAQEGLEKGREVWRDTREPGFGGRYMNALTGSAANTITASISPVLATFEKRKVASPTASEAERDDTWGIQSIRVERWKRAHPATCHGVVQLSSGILSFKADNSSKSKCQPGDVFSAPGGQVKYGLDRIATGANGKVAFSISVPGGETFHFFMAEGTGTELAYLFAALGPRP